MYFKDLKDGDEFTVANLSGSFIRVDGSYTYNAVATHRDSASFVFAPDEVVKLVNDGKMPLVEKFDSLVPHLNSEDNDLAKEFREDLLKIYW